MTRATGAAPRIGALAAALLVPPLAIWLLHGLCPAFWAALVLTCLGFVPGLVFALVAVAVPALVMPGERPGGAGLPSRA